MLNVRYKQTVTFNIILNATCLINKTNFIHRLKAIIFLILFYFSVDVLYSLRVYAAITIFSHFTLFQTSSFYSFNLEIIFIHLQPSPMKSLLWAVFYFSTSTIQSTTHCCVLYEQDRFYPLTKEIRFHLIFKQPIELYSPRDFVRLPQIKTHSVYRILFLSFIFLAVVRTFHPWAGKTRRRVDTLSVVITHPFRIGKEETGVGDTDDTPDGKPKFRYDRTGVPLS